MTVRDEAIMDALAQRLSVSVQNLCASLAASQDELVPCLERLKRAGRIRTVRSSCSGACGSCSSCGDTSSPCDSFTPDTVVISLERPLRTQ